MTGRKHTRREFLKGLSAQDALGDRLDKAMPGGADAERRPADAEPVLLRVSRKAMAARFEILFNAGQYPQATEAAVAALDEVDRLEEQLSYFRTTSELSRINALAASGPVEVEAGLFDLLTLAARLCHETRGAVDVTAGPLSEVWGFARGQGAIPDQQQLDEALARTGCDKLELDAEKRTVRFLAPGMRINLGAMGKGYALDRCAAMLEREGVADFLIHGGQSSVVARGSVGPVATSAAEARCGWAVGVHDPLRPHRRLAEIRLHDRALGTSGSERQFFRHQGRRLGHVLDPRTGWPAEGLLSATVVAPTAVLADGLSTALFVMSPAEAIAFCEADDTLAALLVPLERGRAEVLSSGFGPGELTVLA